MAVGFGVPLAFALGDGAGEAVAGPALWGGGLMSAAAIGFAGAGVFWESSATVIAIASSTGIRTMPLLLSTQA